MHDILPEHVGYWQLLEDSVRELLAAYGYQETRTPVVEMTDLFKRSIGEVTDIVEKEMYTFEDRNGDSLTLRPEGTASCVRACIEHGLIHNQQRRLWYMGPMFRHERPQKGRYRQFHQIGVETFGMTGADIEAELILMTARLWQLLGLEGIELEINTLGNVEERKAHREELIAYFSNHEAMLDEDSKRRLHSNPLRILDTKNPDMQELVGHAPRLMQHLSDESKQHFDRLCELLEAAGVNYRVNTRLVRGLDYYTHTVFEWATDRLGAQGTVCAGGRYDGLVEQLGGRSTPAAGFAMGVERLVALLEEGGQARVSMAPDVYLVAVGDDAQEHGLLLSERLRDSSRELKIQFNCGGGSFKSQMKRADRSGARYAIILGSDEIDNNTVGIKDLRESGEQVSISQAELATWLVERAGQ